MSGAELIGLTSGIISMLGASIQAYDAIKDATGLPWALP